MSLRRLAWGLFALYLALQVVSLWLVWDGPDSRADAFGVVTIGYAVVGALIAARRPQGAVGWLLLAFAIAFSLQQVGDAYSYYPASSPGFLPVLVVSAAMFNVWVFLAVIFLPLYFPDGRLLSRRWRPVTWLGVAAVALGLVGTVFGPDEIDVAAEVANPLVATGTAGRVLDAVSVLSLVLIPLGIALAGASLVVRFRRARGAQRQQLKWFAYACFVGLSALGLAAAAEQGPLANDVAGAIGWMTFLLACLVGVPVATGFAVLRYRLYDIDLVIKRTLVYGSLTAALVGAYLGVVLVLRLVLSPWTGQSDLAVAASTLTVAALFRPLRARIQHVVDRRFYRARYDAARTLESFSGRLRDELDLDALGSDLRRVVQDTVQPAHVSLWLREPT